MYMSLNGFLCCGLDFSSSGACIFVCVYTHTHILKRGLDLWTRLSAS